MLFADGIVTHYIKSMVLQFSPNFS